jgi:hypothetical protein
VIEVVVLTAPSGSLCLTRPHGPSLTGRPNGPHGGPSGACCTRLFRAPQTPQAPWASQGPTQDLGHRLPSHAPSCQWHPDPRGAKSHQATRKKIS